MLCGWGVKSGMGRDWWQVKLCEPITRVISERLGYKLLGLSAKQIIIYFTLLKKSDTDVVLSCES